MRRLHIFLLILFAIIILIGGEGYFYINSLKPQLSGYKELSGLHQEVEVYFDSSGVPHIFAQNEADLYRSFGYIHAQDRLWQMELIRRIGSGRLAEIFGEDLVATDRYFRTLGLGRYAEKTADQFLKNSKPEVKLAVESYLDGVNQFIGIGPTPIEFTILGIEKEEYTIVDIANVMGYMSYNFAHAQRVEPLLSWIAEKYGDEYLKALDVHTSPQTTIIKTFKEDDSTSTDALVALSTHTNKILDALPVATFEGSNSWVFSGHKTETGSVIHVNDPHIGFSQPAVWYEAHLSLPGWDLTGFHLALQPFATIGHNRNVAIGMTMFVNDDMDFYMEKVLPEDSSKYIYDRNELSFEVRTETIEVKKSEPFEVQIRESVHGPIFNDLLSQLKGEPPVALWWLYTKLPSELLDVSYRFNHAMGIEEIQEAASRIHAPGLNVMYGDKDGNIAWWASAKLPIRPDHIDSKFIIDGSTSSNEPTGFYSFDKNPHSVNPPWGYVYTANNQPDSAQGVFVPGHYAPENRARRITELIDQKEKFSIPDMKKMLLDNTSPVARDIASNLLEGVEGTGDFEKKLVEIMRSWDGNHPSEAKAPVIYQKLVYHSMQLAYEDELGKDILRDFRRANVFKRTVARLSREGDNIWWDDTETETIELRKDMVQRALKTTAEELTDLMGTDIESWKWKDVHTLEHGHQLGRVDLLRGYFNVGPFNVASSGAVINNLGFGYRASGEYRVSSGPSTRKIVNFEDINSSWNILPTGNSGVFNSPHYSDQAEMFNNGKFKQQFMDKEEVVSRAKSRLTFIIPRYQ